MICPNCNIEVPRRANGSYRCPKCIFVTFDNLKEIKEMFAILSFDLNGNEGIVAIADNSMGKINAIPAVASDIRLINEFKKDFKRMAKETGQKFKIVKFTQKETLEEF